MLTKDIDWNYGGSNVVVIGYVYPIYRKVRRGKKFYRKLQFSFIMNPLLKAEKVGVSNE